MRKYSDIFGSRRADSGATSLAALRGALDRRGPSAPVRFEAPSFAPIVTGARALFAAGVLAVSMLSACSSPESVSRPSVAHIPVSGRDVARSSKPPLKSTATKRSLVAKVAHQVAPTMNGLEPLPKATNPVVSDELPAVSSTLAAQLRQRLQELDANDGVDDHALPRILYRDGTFDERTRYIGSPELKVARYSDVDDLASPGEYLAFLGDTLVSPAEVAQLTNRYFITFLEGEGYAQVPEDTVRLGKGDCDDLAALEAKVLNRLGKKNGVDYQPRVIAEVPKGRRVGHAVAVYQDGGVAYTLDQNVSRPYTGTANASALFPSVKRANWMEVMTQTPARTYRFPVDGATLNPDYGREAVAQFQGEHFGQGFDTSTLPRGWEGYESFIICFGTLSGSDTCDETAVLKKGVIGHASYETGSLAFEDYDAAGKIEARVYRAGKFRVVEYEDEKPVVGSTFTGQKVSL